VLGRGNPFGIGRVPVAAALAPAPGGGGDAGAGAGLGVEAAAAAAAAAAVEARVGGGGVVSSRFFAPPLKSWRSAAWITSSGVIPFFLATASIRVHRSSRH